MTEEFKGIVTPPMAAEIYESDTVYNDLDQMHVPLVASWRTIPEEEGKLYGQYVWTIRPPGEWCGIVRYREVLITTDEEVPLAIDWSEIYRQLKTHRSILWGRLSSQIGLIGIAVQLHGQPATPLMPGFTAETMQNVEEMDAKGIEQIAEQAHDWPGGLLAPSVLFVQQANPLKNPEHRATLLEKCPEGAWLLGVVKDELKIYEVLA